MGFEGSQTVPFDGDEELLTQAHEGSVCRWCLSCVGGVSRGSAPHHDSKLIEGTHYEHSNSCIEGRHREFGADVVSLGQTS